MELLRFSEIIIPTTRQRRNFDERKMQSLKDSIRLRGLLHPIVLRNASPILVVGERRFRAMQYLAAEGVGFSCNGTEVPSGMVPCLRLAELSPLELEEAELEENVIREDLSFAEKAAAYKRLDDLRRAQAAARGEVHTVKDTATEILGVDAVGYPAQEIRDHILLASHLDDPEIAAAQSAREAMKLLRKKTDAANFAAAAQAAPPSHSLHTLYREDCRSILPSLAAESFSCIVADPPYGVDADSFGEQAGNRHTYSDSPELARALYSFLADESFRLAARAAHLYVFCDVRRFMELDSLFTIAGWRVWPTPLIWAKGGGMLPDPDHAPRRTYESILYAIKGEKKVSMVAPDVITIAMVSSPRRGAEKPAALYNELLRRSTLPGDSVLDPFCGTGPIFEAATKLKLRATGIELDPVAQGIALSRMAEPAPEKGLLEI